MTTTTTAATAVTVNRRSSDWLLNQLPVGMLQDEFFCRFVSIFQDIAASYLEAADGLEHVVDSAVAPVPVLPWLGTWLGSSIVDPSLDEQVQRRLVRSAGEALAWRGTRRGLASWLEAVTGGPVDVDETGGVYREGDAPLRPPVVEVRVQGTGWLPEADFAEVVRAELPAHVGLVLHVDGRLVHPASAAEGPTDG